MDYFCAPAPTYIIITNRQPQHADNQTVPQMRIEPEHWQLHIGQQAHKQTSSLFCWQPLASGLPREKCCYGWLHRRLLRRYRPQSAVSCSTLWERAAGSPPNTSQVSLASRAQCAMCCQCWARSALARQRAHAEDGEASSSAHSYQHHACLCSWCWRCNCTIYIGVAVGCMCSNTMAVIILIFVLGDSVNQDKLAPHPMET